MGGLFVCRYLAGIWLISGSPAAQDDRKSDTISAFQVAKEAEK